jgi:alkanesulfonate monooxygenase SsuD/methylene tetrahydromethanopterin reductase-like flavin-dependent oxidoreductase (luciferase family)
MRRALKYGLPWQPTRLSPAEVAPLAHQYLSEGGVGLKIRTRMSVTEPVRNPEAFTTFTTLVGSAEYFADQIAAYAALGAAYVSVVPGYDQRSCAETIDALGVAKRLLGD